MTSSPSGPPVVARADMHRRPYLPTCRREIAALRASALTGRSTASMTDWGSLTEGQVSAMSRRISTPFCVELDENGRPLAFTRRVVRTPPAIAHGATGLLCACDTLAAPRLSTSLHISPSLAPTIACPPSPSGPPDRHAWRRPDWSLLGGVVRRSRSVLAARHVSGIPGIPGMFPAFPASPALPRHTRRQDRCTGRMSRTTGPTGRADRTAWVRAANCVGPGSDCSWSRRASSGKVQAMPKRSGAQAAGRRAPSRRADYG
jgi:hypothetical protein